MMVAGVGWPLCAYLSNRWYKYHIQGFFHEIADKQLNGVTQRGFN